MSTDGCPSIVAIPAILRQPYGTEREWRLLDLSLVPGEGRKAIQQVTYVPCFLYLGEVHQQRHRSAVRQRLGSIRGFVFTVSTEPKQIARCAGCSPYLLVHERI